MEDFKLDFDMPDFDFGGFDMEGFESVEKIETRYMLPKPYKSPKTHAVKYDRAVELVKSVSGAILNGETVHALLSGNFIFGDFFEAFAVENNILYDEIQLSTLSMSVDNVDSLHNLLAGGYLKKLDLIVSDYFWSHNRQNAPYIYDNLDINDSFQLAVSGTHTKIALIKIGDQKIVISGSANLRSSRCIEEITIQTSDELYDFHHEWQTVILEQYGTIKKAVRAGRLYDAIIKNTEGKKSWLHE